MKGVARDLPVDVSAVLINCAVFLGVAGHSILSPGLGFAFVSVKWTGAMVWYVCLFWLFDIFYF